MSLNKIKILLALTQAGSIWAKNRKEIKILKTLTVVGFLALFFATAEKENDPNSNFNNL